MPTLYVATPGASIRKTSRRLVVSTIDTVLQSVRLRELDRVVIWGPVQITTPAIQALLEGKVDTTFLSSMGRFIGKLVPPSGKNVFLRKCQAQRHDDLAFRLKIARAIVATKARNARRVLQLYGRNRPAVDQRAALFGLKRVVEKVGLAKHLVELMGYEGEAAAIYFGEFGKLPLNLSFSGRSRRPPRDPINALLSLGYTLLAAEAGGALAAHGLDPGIGFLHELDYGRPSLALDLIEAFRHPVVDRLTLSLVNRRVLVAEDFEIQTNGGYHLSDRARRRYLRFYDRCLTSEFRRTGTITTSYRRLLQEQAGELAAAVLGKGRFVPFQLS